MNRIRSGLILVIFALLAFGGSYLRGGGPNELKKQGQIYRWNSIRPVPFSIDQGTLGNLPEADALALVRDSTAKWTNIPTSVIALEEGDRLPLDVNVGNYREYFGMDSEVQELCPENPVIFDDDGKIIDDYLGDGANSSVLGFAGIRFRDDSSREFLSAWVVINGARFSDSPDLVEAGKVITHELGHLIGLDHSQGLPENFSDASWGGEVPLMYPVISSSTPDHPIHDDIAWVSWLYPTDEFAEQVQTSSIRGTVLRPSGVPLLGANVIARRVVNGELSREDITSGVSGFLMLEQGEFELPGLEPGDYAICIEPLKSSFTGGSSIGPYDIRPVNFPRDYFDELESASEDTGTFKVITLNAGETADALVIVANETTRYPGSLTDDDEILYAFPEGFNFPFYGRAYQSVYLSSDGILSFRVGDLPDGSSRSESRFLGGPPRIAPLYSDLNPGLRYGGVMAEVATDGDSITFTWDQVPEYAYPPVYDGSTFSVQLFRDGDITINYGEIRITPDSSTEYAEGLNAIVGISPGGLEAGTSRDLIPGSRYDADNGEPLYQVFPGDNFDLEYSTLTFNAARSRLFFPFVRSTGEEFTGIALANLSSGPADFDFEARDGEGLLQPDLVENPAHFELEGGAQLALLSREIFNGGSESEEGLSHSWIRILASRPEIGSFLQTGNGMLSRQSRLDGAVAITEPSTSLYFTRLYQGAEAFPVKSGPGALPAVTTLAMANPGNDPVQVRLKLYTAEGIQAGVEAILELEPQGHASCSLEVLFPGEAENIGDGFVAAEATAGIVGFEFIELEDTCIGLNAAVPSFNRMLYSAQLACHATIDTSIKIVNPTGHRISFILNGFLVTNDESVAKISSSWISLEPRHSFQMGAGEVFGLTLSGDRIIVGSLQLAASEPGLVGDVVFGDPSTAAFAAALPLQSRLCTRAVQGHISNGSYPGDRTRDAFTGIALFNPGILDAVVKIRALAPEGSLAGETAITLVPGGRLSRTLAELIPATSGMSGGYVSLESSRPVVAQQLFGGVMLDYLSAVPPAVVE